MQDQETEAVAFEIYRVFIRRAVGTHFQQRDRNGRAVVDAAGKPVLETEDQAVNRRWRMAPEKTRDEFREYARAAIETMKGL